MKSLLPLGILLLLFGCSREQPAPPPSTTTAPETQPAPAPTATQPTVQTGVTLPAGAPIPANGVLLWLAADDALASARDGKVTEWRSAQVPNATAIPVHADHPPAVVGSVLNGHAVVRFDGTDQQLRSSVDIRPTTMPEGTVITVFTSTTPDPAPLRKIYGNDDGGYDRAVGLDNRAQPTNFTIFTGRGVAPYFQLTSNTPYVLVDEYTPAEFNGSVNGAPMANKVEAEWSKDALPNLYIGGTGTVYNEFWSGDLAEIIVYARRLNAAERTQVEDYLAAKYGVTLKREPQPATTTTQ